MKDAWKKLFPGLKSNLLRFGLKRLRAIVEVCIADSAGLNNLNWWSCTDYGRDGSDPQKDEGYFRLIFTKEGNTMRLYHLFMCPGFHNVVVSSVQLKLHRKRIVSKSRITSHGKKYWKKIKELGYLY